MLKKKPSNPRRTNATLFWLVVCAICYPYSHILGQDTPLQYLDIAREQAYKKQYDSAAVMLGKAIAIDPNYLPARTFRVRNLGYQEKTEEAVTEAQNVLKINREYIPAYIALTDVYLWAAQYNNALASATNGLFYEDFNLELLQKKAEVEFKLGRFMDCRETTRKLLRYDATNTVGLDLQEKLKKEIRENHVGVVYNLDSYENILGNANALSFYYMRDAKAGPWTLRVNQAIRAGRSGLQFEGDWYPKISRKSYLYLNGGISTSSLFPLFRAGGEIYTDIGKGWEVSAGFRYLFFNSNAQPLLLTGQAGKYWGNNYISGRLFLAFDSQAPKTTRSFVFLYRRYLSSARQWLGLIAATGFIPDNRALASGSALDDTGVPVYFATTRRIGVSWQQPLGKAWWFRLTVGAGEQEDLNTPVVFDSFLWGSIQLDYSF